MLFKNKLLAAAAAFLALTSCNDENSASSAAQQIPTVSAVRVEPKDIPLTFEYAARAQGSKETEVRARVGGILLKRNYVEGSTVKEGDVLKLIPSLSKWRWNRPKPLWRRTRRS